MAAMVGTRAPLSSSWPNTVDAALVVEYCGVVKARNWLMSVPEAKALSPAPWKTSTLMARSWLACSQIWASRSYIANVNALRACGRLKVTLPIPSAKVEEKIVRRRRLLFHARSVRLCVAIGCRPYPGLRFTASGPHSPLTQRQAAPGIKPDGGQERTWVAACCYTTGRRPDSGTQHERHRIRPERPLLHTAVQPLVENSVPTGEIDCGGMREQATIAIPVAQASHGARRHPDREAFTSRPTAPGWPARNS